MYLNYFELKKEPFNITPDPEFLYMSPAHKEALASIIYGVEQRKGFIAIVGEVGVGKTTILRSYLDRVNREKLRPIYLFNANISFKYLMMFLSRELGLTTSSDNIFDMVQNLHTYLVKEYGLGRNIVLLIDEAQNMPVETLENLRLLSNLETAKEKLIQVVFSAQPEFEQMLARKELRQLKQRIAVKATIRPLTNQESMAYIRHRLTKAMAGDMRVFSSGAINLISEHAKGIPRLINIFCDNSLVTSFGYKRKIVDAAVAREIIADFAGPGVAPMRWWLVPALVLVTVISAGGMYFYSAPFLLKSGPLQRPENVQVASTKAPEVSQLNQAALGETPAQPPAVNIDDSTDTESPSVVPMTIKRGDTLANLILNRYGYVNRKAIELVKKHNPSIKNENKIIEGEKIAFPAQVK